MMAGAGRLSSFDDADAGVPPSIFARFGSLAERGKPAPRRRQRTIQRLVWQLMLRLPVPVRLFLWRLAVTLLPYPIRRFLRASVFQRLGSDVIRTGAFASSVGAADATAGSPPDRYGVVALVAPSDPRPKIGPDLAALLERDGHPVYRLAVGATVATHPPRPSAQRPSGSSAPDSSHPLDLAAASEAWLHQAFEEAAAFQVRSGHEDVLLLIDDPRWGKVAGALRDRFGWKIVYDQRRAVLPASSEGDPTVLDLDRCCDLVVARSPRDGSSPGGASAPVLSVSTALQRGTEEWFQVKQRLASLFPKVSIVVLTYNNLEYTRLCLTSIFTQTTYPNYEVIVVDNGSQDATPAYLNLLAAERANVKVILNQTNEGYARGNNQGVAASTGEYLILLNNDTVVTPPWVSRLVRYARDPRVGMVGPVTNWSGYQSRIDAPYESLAEMQTFAETYTITHAGETFDADVLVFFCVAMRRGLYDEIGPLDERFGRGTYEDIDYSLRVTRAGYRLICARDVFVHHWGSASFALLDGKEHLRLVESNLRKFEEKWQTKWRHRPPDASARWRG